VSCEYHSGPFFERPNGGSRSLAQAGGRAKERTGQLFFVCRWENAAESKIFFSKGGDRNCRFLVCFLLETEQGLASDAK